MIASLLRRLRLLLRYRRWSYVNRQYVRRRPVRCTRPIPILGSVTVICGTAWASLDRQTGGIR